MAGVGNVGGGGNWGVMSTQLHALKSANQGAGDKHVRGIQPAAQQLYVHGDKTAWDRLAAAEVSRRALARLRRRLTRISGLGSATSPSSSWARPKGPFEFHPEKGLKLKDLGKLDHDRDGLRCQVPGRPQRPVVPGDGRGEILRAAWRDVEECIANASSPQARADANQLSDLQKVAIHTYTDHKGGATLLNRMLRDAPEATRKASTAPSGQSYIQHIDGGLAALPPTQPGQLQVVQRPKETVGVMAYRGAKRIRPPTVEQGYRKGNEVTEFAFTSTSASNDKSFGGAFQFTISPVAARRRAATSAPSRRTTRREILFPPGTKFDVISRKGDADFLGIEMEAGTGVNVVMREK